MKPSLPAEIGQALQLTGWLPDDVDIASFPSERGVNLLPGIARAWVAFSSSAGNPTRVPRWLARMQSRSAKLAWGVAEPAANRWEWEMGHRLIYWPDGEPIGERLAIVSSRLGRRLDTRKSWFHAIRSACEQIENPREILLTANGNSVETILARAAYLFQLRLIVLSICRDADSPSEWLARHRRKRQPPLSEGIFRAEISPPLTRPANRTSAKSNSTRVPDRDRAVVFLGDLVLALSLRRAGNLDTLIRQRLKQFPEQTKIAVGPTLTRPHLAEELFARGAQRWTPPPPLSDRQDNRPLGSLPSAAPIITLSSRPVESYLTHWTRACPGPWPGESMESYLDQLILDADGVDRSAEAALSRIAEQQQIVASSATLRGTEPMVSFTAVPLSELPNMRVFRPHRGRWDFEPYGICIRRDWVENRGGRLVQYGTDADWEALPETERPFFQLRHTRGSGEKSTIDWKCEQEWRIAGDLDLRDLGPDETFLFVPTHAEATRLASMSRWPIVVLGKQPRSVRRSRPR